ncbi:MAG: protoporphyrinogen oxidase [Acidobacteria bacterium]|nr:protoporphyrinogen oxidase [Acidobacteriota bacterium]
MDALVVGAGISGLAAARRLRREGWSVRVLEAGDVAGGCLATIRQDGFTAELGANTVQESEALLELCRDAGCADELIPASDRAARRYLVHAGRLEPLPGHPGDLLRSPVLGFGAKLRLLMEPFIPRGPGGDETLATFFRRRLGRAAAESLGDAMVLGVYAGDPAELVAGHAFPRLHRFEQEHGSLIRGALATRRSGVRRRRLLGYRHGFAALAEALTHGLDVRFGEAVTSISPGPAGFEVEAGRSSHGARRLVLALPQQPARELLTRLDPETGLPDPLPAAPVAVVALGYSRRDVAHPLDGFGFLAPHREGRNVLGCLFPSTLFDGRAPEGSVLLIAMLGGRRRPEIADLPEGELYATAEAELAELLGIKGSPVFRAHRRWRPGIPQPTAARKALLRAVDELERRHPGLEVLGNWCRGVGIPDCAAAGWGGFGGRGGAS